VQLAGVTLAVAGLVWMMLPGATAPSLAGTSLMSAAGIAWGIYSLRRAGGGDPTRVTAGNSVRAAPIALVVAVLWPSRASFDSVGVWYAIASGALASGAGYAIWYSAITALKVSTASIAQLSVPVIAALGGAIFRGEPSTARWVLPSGAESSCSECNQECPMELPDGPACHLACQVAYDRCAKKCTPAGALTANRSMLDCSIINQQFEGAFGRSR
jgi:EamA-like transporter family